MRRALLRNVQNGSPEDLGKGTLAGTGFDCFNQVRAVPDYSVAHQVALRGKVTEEGTPGNASLLRDIIDRRLVVAFFREKVRCGIPDRGPDEFLFPRLERGDCGYGQILFSEGFGA
jgi:hypothetical protein